MVTLSTAHVAQVEPVHFAGKNCRLFFDDHSGKNSVAGRIGDNVPACS